MEIALEGLVALITTLAPWVLGWFALGGNAHSVEQNIEGFGQSLTQGPVNTAVNAWMKVLLIGGAFGLVIWGIEVEASKRLGVAAPSAPSLAPSAPTAPTFGATGGYSASAGPLTTYSGVGVNAAPTGPVARRQTAPRQASRGGSTFRRRR